MPNSFRVKMVTFLLKIHEKLFHPNFGSAFVQLYADTSPEDMVIFDIGAHRGERVGAFSRLFPGAEIHAFEPDAENFCRLHADWGGVENVRINNIGVGDHNGEREFYQHLLTTTSTFQQINMESEWVKLKSKLLNVPLDELIYKTYKVQMVKLDDYVRENSIEHICILKFDTEGSEFECLEGCQEILAGKRVDVIQVEGHHGDVYRDSASYDQIVEVLAGYGYASYKQRQRFLNRDLVDAILVREGFGGEG